MAGSDRAVSVSRVVKAPPQRVFDILADPSMHPVIDGSGSVRAPLGSPNRLSEGARFSMRMRIGAPYRMSNRVVEFCEGERLAWRQGVGHHVWRYELDPVDGGTRVTETFDWSTSRTPLLLRLMKAPQRNRRAMEKTLERLATEAAR